MSSITVARRYLLLNRKHDKKNRAHTASGEQSHSKEFSCFNTLYLRFERTLTSDAQIPFIHDLFICLFSTVLVYCNLVNSHLKSRHHPVALKSMIFIFTTSIRPMYWKIQSKPLCFLFFSLYVFCLFTVIRKKKIYNNNNRKEKYYDWQAITAQHKYLFTARNKWYK